MLFSSIPALQEQNQKLLKIARELGAKMEEEEREYREDLEKEQVQAVYEAHEAIRKLQDELEAQKRTIDIKTQAYNKELEALKGTLAKERAMTRSNGARAVNGRGSDVTDGTADSVQELAEVQSQFEAYKAEMGEDSIRLREELLVVQRETGQLGAALAKANAKVEYLNGELFAKLSHVPILTRLDRSKPYAPGPNDYAKSGAREPRSTQSRFIRPVHPY